MSGSAQDRKYKQLSEIPISETIPTVARSFSRGFPSPLLLLSFVGVFLGRGRWLGWRWRDGDYLLVFSFFDAAATSSGNEVRDVRYERWPWRKSSILTPMLDKEAFLFFEFNARQFAIGFIHGTSSIPRTRILGFRLHFDIKVKFNWIKWEFHVHDWRIGGRSSS